MGDGVTAYDNRHRVAWQYQRVAAAWRAAWKESAAKLNDVAWRP